MRSAKSSLQHSPVEGDDAINARNLKQEENVQIAKEVNLDKLNYTEKDSTREIKVVDQSVKSKKSIHSYETEFRKIIKEMSPLFFNLNSSLNFSGLDKLKFNEKVCFDKEGIREFLHLVARFTSGGKFPVQVEVSRQKLEQQIGLCIKVTNTNSCLLLDSDVKESIHELNEILTHDKVVLGFGFEKVFENTLENNSNVSSIFVGPKKELLKKLRDQSADT